MSISGEIIKISGDVRRAINQIAMQGMTGLDGAPRGTKKYVGYVCEIHEDGELAGTVDVQEFNYDPGEYHYEGAGHHSGVFLSAIQDNEDGYLIVPQLFSDVVVVQNPTDGREYVVMYSHAKKIRMLTHSLEGDKDGMVEIGVTEVEDFVETEDGLEKGFDELEPTKNKTLTQYTATAITDTVVSPDDEEGLKQEKTAEHKTITVGKTKITIDGENVSIETSGNVTFKVGGTTITEDSGKVTVKATDIQAEGSTVTVKGSDVTVDGSTVTITGGTLKTKGMSSTDLNGPFNAIKVCPFSGAPHCGSQVSGT